MYMRACTYACRMRAYIYIVTFGLQAHRLVWAAQTSPYLAHTKKSPQGTQHLRGLVFLGYAIERGEDSWQLFVENSRRLPTSQCSDLLKDDTCAAVQVYNGETRYGDQQRQQCTERLLPDDDGKRGAVDLVQMRGAKHTIAYSQLERIVGLPEVASFQCEDS
jgi:hypothetical protein